MGLLPMAMFGLEVPAGDVAIPAIADVPAAFRITMAAIDPDAEAEGDGTPRATLKIIRQRLISDSDDDSEDFDIEDLERRLADEDSDSSEDDEEVNGGPSDPAKSKKALLKKILEDDMDVVDDEDGKPNGINGVTKSAKAIGKMPASDEDEDEDDSDSDEFDDVQEFVICTLDPTKNFQQPLDLTIGEDERVFFKVSGTHSIFLTGNYVEPEGSRGGMFDPDSDEEDDVYPYDLDPDEDELDESLDESMDELDGLEDPRIKELEDEEEEEAPKLIKHEKKSKNKRPAPDAADEDEVAGGAETLDEMMAKEAKKVEPVVNGDKPLSKKQLKKLKRNDGTAASAPVEEKKESETPSSIKSDKKVSFAKDLEQGPTPSKDKAADKDKSASKGVKVVQGVTIDEKKVGTGQAAKNGDRISMRYIGKLDADKKVFDSNTKGKPFSFKLGVGEVIKGWEIGVQGMQAGGERRITIPPHLAYGSKKMPEIPANSTLVFDIKMLDITKK